MSEQMNEVECWRQVENYSATGHHGSLARGWECKARIARAEAEADFRARMLALLEQMQWTLNAIYASLPESAPAAGPGRATEDE
jgi:hypothetical protein